MKVINLIGGPCTGKTTTALGLAHVLLKIGASASFLSDDFHARGQRERPVLEETVILAERIRRLDTLKSMVEFAIVESPPPYAIRLGPAPLSESDRLERGAYDALAKLYWSRYEHTSFTLPFDDFTQAYRQSFSAVLPPDATALRSEDDHVSSVLACLGLAASVVC